MQSLEHSRIRRELSSLIRTHLGDLAACGGEVLMTGIDSVKPGPLYLMGLNPGIGSKISITEHVERWDLTRFSAYKHQCWYPQCWATHAFGRQEGLVCNHGVGVRNHQKVVKRLVEEVFKGAFSLESIVATNAIFAASRSADSFHAECKLSLEEAWRRCWPVHAWLLGIVQPAVILCWGFGESRSAFSYLRDIARPADVIRRKSFKYFDARFELGQITIASRVIGVFHPSYGFRLGQEVDAFRDLVNARLMAG